MPNDDYHRQHRRNRREKRRNTFLCSCIFSLAIEKKERSNEDRRTNQVIYPDEDNVIHHVNQNALLLAQSRR